MTFPAGGRGEDVNGDGVIGPNEGSGADAVRQMGADLMQLVRVLEVGMDVDGDGTHDLDPARLYYVGNSAGGNYGAPFLAVEPSVRAGVLTVTGGLGFNRLVGGRAGTALANRVPSLINSPGVTHLDGVPTAAPYYFENIPLRGDAVLTVQLEDDTTQEIRGPVVNTVEGANAIQAALENSEWINLARGPTPYAPHLRRAPLPGVATKSVIFQFGQGDRTVVNPSTTATLRAGDLADRTLYFRNDLAFAEDPAVPKSPHSFMTSIGSMNSLVRAIALGAQQQIAVFFASDGKTVIHPEPRRFFEVPIKGPLPEELNYIP